MVLLYAGGGSEEGRADGLTLGRLEEAGACQGTLLHINAWDPKPAKEPGQVGQGVRPEKSEAP